MWKSWGGEKKNKRARRRSSSNLNVDVRGRRRLISASKKARLKGGHVCAGNCKAQSRSRPRILRCALPNRFFFFGAEPVPLRPRGRHFRCRHTAVAPQNLCSAICRQFALVLWFLWIRQWNDFVQQRKKEKRKKKRQCARASNLLSFHHRCFVSKQCAASVLSLPGGTPSTWPMVHKLNP